MRGRRRCGLELSGETTLAQASVGCPVSRDVKSNDVVLETEKLLELYDEQLRAHVPVPLPAGVTVEREGPLVRTIGFGQFGWVEYRDLGDLSEADLDRLIRAQIARFAERDQPFEWKFHSHDRPPFLEERLTAAGFVAEELETVVIAETAALADGGPVPAGVVLREVGDRIDFERIGEMEAAAWGSGEDSSESWYPTALEQLRRMASSSRPGGCGSRAAPTSQPFGAARRCPRGAGVASIVRSCAAAPSWQPSGDGATWRLTRRPTAGRSSSGWASGQSPTRGRTSGRPRPPSGRSAKPSPANPLRGSCLCGV